MGARLPRPTLRRMTCTFGWLLFATVSLAAGASARPDATPVAGDTLMALYTYNFAKFTEWPPAAFDRPDSPLFLCVLGEAPFHVGSLATVAGKKVEGHPVVVEPYLGVAALERCHIAFVGRSEEWRADLIVRELSSHPVLTVSDISDFSRRGGMITFHTVGDRLRFDINPEAARKAGLRLSSKLLELARTLVPSARSRGK